MRKRHAQSMLLSRQRASVPQIGSRSSRPGAFLNISPITPYIKDVDKRKAGHFFDVLFQGFAARTRRQRWTAFLPGVAHQSQPRISQRLFGRRGEQDGLPALILIDIEWTLVEPLPHRWAGTEIETLPEMRRNVGPRANRGERGSALEQISSLHREVIRELTSAAFCRKVNNRSISKEKERVKC